MSFGKDETSMPSGGGMSVRQQLRHGAKRAPRGSGGGGGLLYRDQYRPPSDGTSDIVRIIPGSYPLPQIDYENKDFVYNEAGSVVTANFPYWKYTEYYFAPRKRTIIGSEGPLGGFKGKGNPSLVSDWFWWEYNERQRTGNKKSPNTLRRTERNAVSVLVQAPFYKVPQTGKDGKVQMNEKTNQPYMEWKKGSKRGNDEYALGKYEKKNGHVMHWSLAFGQWNVMLAYANGLASSCRSCNTQDSIRELALVCRGCGEAIVEFDSTSLTDAELNKIRDEPVKCRTCGHTGYLDNIIECNNCPHGDEATLFDFDLEVLQVKSSEEDKAAQLQIRKAIGPRPLDASFKDDLRKPLDLPKIFTPFSMEAQEKILGPLPRADQSLDEGDGVQRQPVTGGHRDYA